MEYSFHIITLAFAFLITVCFFYQGIYVMVGLFIKPKKFEAKKKHRYAVLISARNESAVIAHLIESIKTQTYPSQLVDVFVIADNCTDNTAEISKCAGAIVYERFNKTLVGKGYALHYLLELIDKDYGISNYDGYFVFDADNVLEKDYIEQMNHVFDNGYRIVTSYRNSKNFGSNWISSGYALWFLREAKYVNNARMTLGVSCAVSGTGFLIHSDIIKKNKGWNYYLLTEDIQFSVDNILKGEKIGYCGDAVFYDEQPVTFRDSWNQRLRWSRGFYQVFFRYGKQLAEKAFGKFDFSCYDMFITLVPGIGLSIISGILGGLSLLFGVLNYKIVLALLIKALITSLFNIYLTFFILGLITLITEWKRICCKPWKKIIYLFTFPIFMFTYIPISFIALFHNPQWKPILHSVSVTAQEIHEL